MVQQTTPQINARTLRGGADIFLDGRKTGCRTRSDILVRDAHTSRGHMLRIPEPSWAFHQAVIDEAIARGCTAVMVIDHDTGRTYYSEMQNFLELGQRFNYGKGDQVRLALRHWRLRLEQSANPAPAAAAVATTPAAATVAQPEPAPQLSLFGEVTR